MSIVGTNQGISTAHSFGRLQAESVFLPLKASLAYAPPSVQHQWSPAASSVSIASSLLPVSSSTIKHPVMPTDQPGQSLS